jgi:alpha-tubulin suppressor-like RCC1 family protein
MRMPSKYLAPTLVALLTVVACDEPAAPEPVASVTLSAAATTVAAGDSLRLTATLHARNGRELDRRPVAWSTTAPGVATVSESGIVAGIAPGTASIIAAAEGHADTIAITVSPARAVSLALGTDSIVVRAFPPFYSARVTATLRDRQGNLLTGRAITWSVADTMIAEAVGIPTASGAQIWGRRLGRTTLVATSEGRSDTLTVIVTPVPVGAVRIAGDTVPVFLGMSSAVVATVLDSTLFWGLSRPIAWETTDPGIARVSQAGVVTGVSIGITQLRATAEGKTATAVVVVSDTAPSDWMAVAAGNRHSCGLARDGTPYCWGWNVYGALGNGRKDTLSYPVPVPVVGGHKFASIHAGVFHTCGLTATGEAWCWGINDRGQLGGPASSECNTEPHLPDCNIRPQAVAGGLRFTTLALGSDHSCGLTAAGAAYCWGANFEGQLGVGDSTVATSSTPRAVAGGLTFRTLVAGRDHVCGLTTSGTAYCWGDGSDGQLGVGGQPAPPYSGLNHYAPAAVAGGHSFRALAAHGFDSCGATERDVYCWGSSAKFWSGEVPANPQASARSYVPVVAARDVSFTALALGALHLCGLTAAGAASCWGSDYAYAGDNWPSTFRTTPQPVSGTLAFSAISAGGGHTCAIAAGDRAYCWGFNRNGELGNASRATATVPARVLRK